MTATEVKESWWDSEPPWWFLILALVLAGSLLAGLIRYGPAIERRMNGKATPSQEKAIQSLEAHYNLDITVRGSISRGNKSEHWVQLYQRDTKSFKNCASGGLIVDKKGGWPHNPMWDQLAAKFRRDPLVSEVKILDFLGGINVYFVGEMTETDAYHLAEQAARQFGQAVNCEV